MTRHQAVGAARNPEPSAPIHLHGHTVQTWKGETQIQADIADMSYDAAKHLAQVHTALGYTVRAFCSGMDYTMVWTPDSYREGPFAKTTLVHAEGGAR